MRARRKALGIREQANATACLARMMARLRLLKPGRRIAVYVRHGSEADPSSVIALARRCGCEVYLPVITHRRRSRMDFVRLDAGAPLRLNAFGILEPDLSGARRIAVRELDLILLPLVAVDPRGWRLGSGAGYYDRRLRHRRGDRRWRRPRLIGIAYEFQRIAHLEPQPWDVPLDAVLTDRGFYPTPRPAAATTG